MAHEQLRSSTIVRALADVVGDFTDLLQKEVQLARAELSANLSAKLQGGVVDRHGGRAHRVGAFFFACKRLSSGSRVTASPFIGLF